MLKLAMVNGLVLVNEVLTVVFSVNMLPFLVLYVPSSRMIRFWCLDESNQLE